MEKIMKNMCNRRINVAKATNLKDFTTNFLYLFL